jgi:hypothetical protein
MEIPGLVVITVVGLKLLPEFIIGHMLADIFKEWFILGDVFESE